MARYDRSIMLIGEAAQEKLQNSSVLIVGVGGVGSSAFEVLIRGGIGNITVVDGDKFELSNLNRQMLSTESNIGQNKAECAKLRASAVASNISVSAFAKNFNASTAAEILSKQYDYCIDAIDSVKDKILLISMCKEKNIPIVSAMGAGNRLTPDFIVTDIFKTQNDPLAKSVRKKLKEIGIDSLKVVASLSPPTVKGELTASIAAPPMVMGAMLANEAIKDICLC